MRRYEGLFFFGAGEGPDGKAAQTRTIENLIGKFDGKISVIHDWGRRTFGYEVKKKRDGNMYLADFEIAPAKLVELRRAITLEASVLKFTATLVTEQVRQYEELVKKQAEAAQAKAASERAAEAAKA